MDSLKTIRLALLLSFALVTTSCGFTAMEMNVVVFNYWPRAMADVYVDGQHVGAGYEQGGGGSKISCCHKVKPGEVEVKWMLGGGVDDPLTGTVMSSSARVNEIKPGAGIWAFIFMRMAPWHSTPPRAFRMIDFRIEQGEPWEH